MAQLPGFLARVVALLPATVRNSAFLKAFAWLSSGTVIQTAVVLAVAPILSRLFLPEHFGVAGLFQAVVGVLTPLAAGSYHGAILLPRRRTDALNIFAIALFLPLVVIPACFLVATAVPAEWLGERFAPSKWLVYAPYIVVGVFLHQALNAYRQWEIRCADYRSVFNSQLLFTAGMVITQLVAGLARWGGIGLIMAQIIGVFCPMVYLGIQQYKSTRGRTFRVLSFKRMKKLAREHWRFPVFSMPGHMFFTSGKHMPSFLLATFFTTAEVGLYWFAYRVLSRMEQSFGVHISRICYQRCAKRRNQGLGNILIFLKSTGFLLAIMLAPMSIIILFGPEIFSLVFGPDWERSGIYARWLCLFVLGDALTLPARSVVNVYQMQKLIVLLEVSKLPCLIAAFIIGQRLGDDVTAVATISMTQLVLCIAFVLIIAGMIRRQDQRGRGSGTNVVDGQAQQT